MGSTKNLHSAKAIAKLKELVSAADVCMFATALSLRPMPVRPMSTAQVDSDGNLWFLSKESSNKNAEIKIQSHVQLFYSNKSNSEFLSVYGDASVIKDKEKAAEIWTPIAKTWFTKGVDDPELTLIKVQPEEAYYWDTKHGKMVAFLKIITGAITGITMDDGVEGQIHI